MSPAPCVRLLGDEDKDVSLVGKLQMELELLQRLNACTNDSECEKLGEKLVHFAARSDILDVARETAGESSPVFRAVSADHKAAASRILAEAAKPSAAAAPTTETTPASADDADTPATEEGPTAAAIAAAALPPPPAAAKAPPSPPPPAEEPARAEAATPQQKEKKGPISDAEAIARLTRFYAAAKAWHRYKSDPCDLHKSFVKKYGSVAESELGWLLTDCEQAPMATPKKNDATPRRPAGAGAGNAATPRGYFAGAIAAIATPVVKMFGVAAPTSDGEPPPAQAILPSAADEKQNYYDEKLGRWVFPGDPEGEAERAALAAAMAGPPPPPSAKKPAAGGGGGAVMSAYVDHFNSAPAGGGDAGAALVPGPPMPPAPAPPPMPKLE